MGNRMKKTLSLIFFIFSLNAAHAANAEVYLSCPGLDERAPDLLVILDKSNSKASLQSPSSGVGLNFTADASFGPTVVTWRRDSGSLKHTFSVDRATLYFERKTIDTSNGLNMTKKTKCTLVKKNSGNKF